MCSHPLPRLSSSLGSFTLKSNPTASPQSFDSPDFPGGPFHIFLLLKFPTPASPSLGTDDLTSCFPEETSNQKPLPRTPHHTNQLLSFCPSFLPFLWSNFRFCPFYLQTDLAASFSWIRAPPMPSTGLLLSNLLTIYSVF